MQYLFKPNASTNNVKYPQIFPFSHCVSLDVAMSCSEVCLWWDDLSILYKRKTCRPLGWSLNLFTWLFLKFGSRLDWHSEGFQKAVVDLIYHRRPDQIRRHSTVTSCVLIDWCAKQSQGEMPWVQWHTNSVWPTVVDEVWKWLKATLINIFMLIKDVVKVVVTDNYHPTVQFPSARWSTLASFSSLCWFLLSASSMFWFSLNALISFIQTKYSKKVTSGWWQTEGVANLHTALLPFLQWYWTLQ